MNWSAVVAEERAQLVEQVDRAAGEAIAAVMNERGRAAGYLPLVWRMDNLRLLDRDRCWPARPRLAICGAPRCGVDVDAVASVKAWADWLGLHRVPPRADHLLEWVGDIGEAMSVRVWAWEIPDDGGVRPRPYAPVPLPPPWSASRASSTPDPDVVTEADGAPGREPAPAAGGAR